MVLYSAFLYVLVFLLFLMLSTALIKKAKERIEYAVVAGGFFSLKFILILINENFRIFEPKIAGNYTLKLYDVYQEIGLDVFIAKGIGMKTFIPQFTLNLIPFEILGASREIMLITNSILTTLAGVIAFFVLKKVYGYRVGFIALFLINMYPAAINFSFFGLRDPVLYFGVVVNIVTIISVYKTKSLSAVFGYLISLYLIVRSRPELVAIIFFPIAITIGFLIRNYYQGVKTLDRKIFVTVMLFFLFVIPSFLAAFLGYNFVLDEIGSVVDPVELMEVQAELRYSRSTGEGSGGQSGSHILPPALYNGLPWYGRWPVQTLGIIILPFPWMVTNVAKVMAFTDSIFLIILMLSFRKYRRYFTNKENFLQTGIFLTFIVGILIMGMIVSNAGNAFRMRLSIAPYVLIPAAIYMGLRFEKTVVFRILKQFLRPNK